MKTSVTQNILSSPSLIIRYINDIGISDLRTQFTEIALHAAKEFELIKMIENVETFWKDSRITVYFYNNFK